MEFISCHYKFQSCSTPVNILHGVSSNSTDMSSKLTVDTADAKAVAACKNHSEAERRRRKRINGHLATLRTLLPSTIKTDKASLLAEVVRHVKELKKTSAEMASSSTNQTNNGSNDQHYMNMFPSKTDELNLSYEDKQGDNPASTIKASLCCDDRPELISDLTKALTTIQAKVVRIEMATVGGRIKCVLWVQVSSSVATRDEGLRLLRQALKIVIDKACTLLYSPAGHKRPCLSLITTDN